LGAGVFEGKRKGFWAMAKKISRPGRGLIEFFKELKKEKSS
jgi:hypothetical protein